MLLNQVRRWRRLLISTRREVSLTIGTKRVQIQLGRRYRQFQDIRRSEGIGGIVDRMRRAAAERLAPRDAILPVRRNDVLAADLSQPFDPAVPKLIPDEPVLVNWVTTPPSAGSGGHTTLFRIVRYLEAHGFLNRIYFYDVYRGDHRYYESIVRRYYGFHGPVARVEQGMPDAHAVFATSWQTAYPVFNSRCAGKRFYFVQDFEPFFYPTGSLSLLAENTYRMGFHAVTAGSWLAQKLSEEFGMCADFFQFGCDTSHYQRLENSRRSGVVFYARPEAARRGVELGLMAIESFARRRPDIQIHLYGQKMGRLPFSYVDHGRIGPDELNRIYNACYAGLSLSFTNVSLVPHEMLAAGCIPVVNDAMQNRMVLDNPFVRYVPPSAHALAAELEALVANSDFEALARAASGSVRLSSWQNAGASVVRIIENNLKRDISSLRHASGNRLSDGGVSYCPARL